MALFAYDAGLCVLPPGEYGLQAPEVSGGMELFEFDDRDVFEQFKELAQVTVLDDLVVC